MGKRIIAQIKKEMSKEKREALKTGDTRREFTKYSHNYCTDHSEHGDTSPRHPKDRI